jgi:hypothetical protein
MESKKEAVVKKPKIKMGRPKLEKIWLLNGEIVDKRFLDNEMKENTIAGSVVKELVVKTTYKVALKSKSIFVKA